MARTAFTAGIGAEAIREMLMASILRRCVSKSAGDRGGHQELKPKGLAKRLKVIEAFIQSGNRPEWMIMKRHFR